MAGLLAGGALAVVLFFVLGVLISAIFIYIGVKLAKVQRATFGRAFGAALLMIIINFVVGLIVGLATGGNPIAGFIVGLLITLFVIKGVFSTSLGKAFVAWIFAILSQIIVFAILAIAGLGAMSAIL
jgi:hypothetical protein